MATLIESTLSSPRPGLDLYRMTVDEYERLAEAAILDDHRVELIDGYLVRKMTKKPPHVIAVEGMCDALLVLALPGWRVMIQDPVRRSHPLISMNPNPTSRLREAPGRTTRAATRSHEIGLIVEVADSSLPTDRGEKLAAYARGGVPRYWIVNLVDGVIETYSSPVAAGEYQASRVYHRGDEVPVVIDGQEVGRIAAEEILS